jgi:predicted extracellular nuclease
MQRAIRSIKSSAYGAGANSVAVSNGLVAIAVEATNKTDPGKVVFFKADGTFQNAVTVGALPDMLTFSPDGKKVLVANEGEPNSYNQANSVDPVGSVSIIDLRNEVANATVNTAGFESFNALKAELQAKGIRITGPNASVAQDLEPEYTTVSADSKIAWVTLQENNAIAVVDVTTAKVTDLLPLGLKDHRQSNNGLDPSDRDSGINIRNQPVFGMYQPDAIASFTVNGETFVITANEGDARDYTGFTEEVRVGSNSYRLDPNVFPNATDLKRDANLGRLNATNATGDTNGDGLFDRIEVFGTRSFSIRDSSGNLVFDSGDQFEEITAAALPANFNSDNSANNFDNRSDNKGPEPEAVVIGTINDRIYAFIGLERIGGVMVYEVTNPRKPVFVEYINPRDFSVDPTSGRTDSGPEGLTFIAAKDSPNGKPLLVVTNEISNTTSIFEFNSPTRISDIQGPAHRSPLEGKTVNNVAGIVTAIRNNGFYIQDPTPDSNPATSEGVFVFTNTRPVVALGDSVSVNGIVSEFRPGGATSTNLTTTQIGGAGNATATFRVVSSNNPLPDSTTIGAGGRIPPNQVISSGAVNGNVENPGSRFEPSTNGIDFYESLEGMRVQVNDAVAVSPTTDFGEIAVLADNGANAGPRTARGGIYIQPNDFNPERIIIDDALVSNPPDVNVGDRFSAPVNGVLDYSFGNFKLLNTQALPSVVSGGLTRETTDLKGGNDQLTVATFNVENLSPASGAEKFATLANRIVNNLKAPDILSVEEIQDNSGPTDNGIVDANLTYQRLIDAIVAAGGPRYEYRQINPVNNQDGGQSGGNIRVGFLFNPSRTTFVDRPGGGSLTDTTVVKGAFGPELSASPGRIDPTDPAFNSSRKPLVGEFLFNGGNQVFVIGNHFNSKGGDQPLFGPSQPPTLTTEAQRLQQAQIVREFVDRILALDSNANVVVAGDLNDFQFSPPLQTLTRDGALVNLFDKLPANEQYTYIFDGNSQVLDHILASRNLVSSDAKFDVVHINSEFADQVSDHDPVVSRFTLGPNGARGQRSFDVKLGDQITITNFGGVGRGNNPNAQTVAEVDTLKFSGKDLIAQNLLLNQNSNDLEITFDGIANTKVVLKNFQLENLENLQRKTGASIDIGNILFTDQTTISDSFDVFDADATLNRIFNRNTVTFSNDLDNTVSGFNNFDDVINAQGGNDTVFGLSGNDLLRGGFGNDRLFGELGNDSLFGGEGDDFLDGGLGDDLLRGDAGRDTFVISRRPGTDTIADFQVGVDLIALSEGLRFEQLSIAPGSGGAAANTLISLTRTGDVLAILTGVQANTMTSSSFVLSA